MSPLLTISWKLQLYKTTAEAIQTPTSMSKMRPSTISHSLPSIPKTKSSISKTCNAVVSHLQLLPNGVIVSPAQRGMSSLRLNDNGEANHYIFTCSSTDVDEEGEQEES
ncbi:hypothetical protein M0R45_018504 [Rubus argutus]|uniref:Uncharacterized protein n=1 Tax=Rubus argutus TaxID=59490 RepID=A0AAW1X652_RUBAR